MRVASLFAALVVVLVGINHATAEFAVLDSPPLPSAVVREQNPFERLLSPMERQKLRLSADMATLHHIVHDLERKIPSPPAPIVRERRGVKAINIGFLPADPEGHDEAVVDINKIINEKEETAESKRAATVASMIED